MDDWSWAIGLFEGEGCIHAGRLGPRGASRSQRRLSLGMIDLDVVERFHSIVGVGKIDPHNSASANHTMHYWRCYVTEECLTLLDRIEPHLSARRRIQAQAFRDGIPLARAS